MTPTPQRVARIAATRTAGVARRIWGETIWAPGAIPAHEGELAQDLKRVVLPIFDAVIVIIGLVAIDSGMPSFDILYNIHLSDLTSHALLIAGIAAGAGVSFPRLWLAEAIGKIVIVTILGGYAAALWVLAAQGIGSRGFVAAALTGIVILPLWNLVRLGRERRRRHASRRRRAAALAALAAITATLPGSEGDA